MTKSDFKELTSVADENRNEDWEDRFLHGLSLANLELLSEDPQTGPDGWPYLMATTSEKATEPSQKILAWLASRGIGLVVNPQKSYPDFILTYGMIWNFRETGRFIDRRVNVKAGKIEMATDQVRTGEPTEKFLPGDVRKILREFMRDQGILRPRIAVIENEGHADLAFSLESLGNSPEHEHASIAEAFGWFLPTHYPIVFVSEKSLLRFIDL